MLTIPPVCGILMVQKNFYEVIIMSTLIYRAPVEVAGTLSGIVTLPSDFDPAKESLPVIVFLHGAGERGDGCLALLRSRNRQHCKQLYILPERRF